MSTYICKKCGCVDNTACGGNYWTVQGKVDAFNEEYANKNALCSECTPSTYADGSPTRRKGMWHGMFEKKHWSEYGSKETIIEECKKNQGNFVNAVEYFSDIEKKGVSQVEVKKKAKATYRMSDGISCPFCKDKGITTIATVPYNLLDVYETPDDEENNKKIPDTYHDTEDIECYVCKNNYSITSRI